MSTHQGRDKTTANFLTTFSNAVSWMKMYEFLYDFIEICSQWVKLTIFQHWFRWQLGAVQAPIQYLNHWWLVYWRIHASFSLNEWNAPQFISSKLTKIIFCFNEVNIIQVIFINRFSRQSGLFLKIKYYYMLLWRSGQHHLTANWTALAID